MLPPKIIRYDISSSFANSIYSWIFYQAWKLEFDKIICKNEIAWQVFFGDSTSVCWMKKRAWIRKLFLLRTLSPIVIHRQLQFRWQSPIHYLGGNWVELDDATDFQRHFQFESFNLRGRYLYSEKSYLIPFLPQSRIFNEILSIWFFHFEVEEFSSLRRNSYLLVSSVNGFKCRHFNLILNDASTESVQLIDTDGNSW